MTHALNFAGLGLAQPLLRALVDAGYAEPTPVQTQAIPLVLKGDDLLAAAQTGTGKTAGFTLPILQRLDASRTDVRPGQPRCLILTPTRELAAQVEESVQAYGKYLPIKSMVMFGGVGMMPQVQRLKKRVDILVATPGRLLDHCGQKTLDLSRVEILVLDEADRMLDMGFIRDIKRVLALLPAKRQNLMFSATFSDEIRALADGMLNNPGRVEVARRNAASELVQQTVYLVSQEHKRDALSHLIRQHRWQQVLVFTRTKHGANRLAEKLEKDGIPAAAIHGNKSQGARTRALAQFKDGTVPVLVATDIAARGLDIDQLPHVVNFELPNVPEDYVHRIGRTGRAGSTGAAVSLVDHAEMDLLAGIERLLKRKIERVAVEGFDPAQRPAHHHGHPPSVSDRHRNKPRDGRDARSRDGNRQPQDGKKVGRHHRRNAEHGNAARHGAGETPRRDNARPAKHGSAAGNRGAAQPQREKHLSEAARHQAQPQPALFSPPAGRRYGNRNGNR
ncbi:MAG: DEAD/DEAH box helicase [Rhodospirillaceae bacterium]